jgi:uncharacterized protein YecT (DUF1311 family)
MTSRPRRDHTPTFQAKLALAAIKGERALAELAQQFEASANKIAQGRNQPDDGAADVLGDALPEASTSRGDVIGTQGHRPGLKQLVLAAALGMAVLCPSLSFGQDAGVAGCSNTETQLQIDECMSKHLAEADAALGAVYSKLLDALDPTRKMQARAAERAWISYKTEMCKFVGLSREGGSMQGSVVAQCLIDMAHEETTKLQWQLACGASGELLPRQGEVCNF